MPQQYDVSVMPTGEQILAVEYVRMSTEHQKYSTENQSQIIHEYAQRRGIKIIKTYADEGKSGLKIDGRHALQRLLADVEGKASNFSTILVYDVSRWGRFQDSDEGAYYEYRCKRAGITVQYCAEQFENDGSPVSTIVKGVKRAMAGEYSRELSAKVFTGQCRLIELGYRQGGPAGFGLRRKLVDQSGETKALLARGEHKSIQTDRVILVPGPDEEVSTVRWIYRTFVEDGKLEREIAHDLNNRGILTDRGHEWSRGTVHQILINEKYIGNNVWNRVSFKLKRNRIRNAPDMLVRAENAFESIVDEPLFEAAQAIIRERSKRLTDDQMLEALRQIYEAYGYLSGIVIDEAEQLPSSSAYHTRFGSLLRAYQLVGFTPERDYTYIEINRSLRTLHPEIIEQTISGIETIGGTVTPLGPDGLLEINGEFTASIVIARCLFTGAGSLRWNIRLDASLAPDLTIAVRMDESNKHPMDYYFLPRLDMSLPKLRLAQHNGTSLDSYRFDSLEDLFPLAARANLQEVA